MTLTNARDFLKCACLYLTRFIFMTRKQKKIMPREIISNPQKCVLLEGFHKFPVNPLSWFMIAPDSTCNYTTDGRSLEVPIAHPVTIGLDVAENNLKSSEATRKY